MAPMLRCLSPDARRYIALGVSCLVLTLCGSYFIVSILSVDMQQEFSLTQTAVEIIVGCGAAAGHLGYPWGLLLERIGERRALITAMFLGSIPALLLYFADYSTDFYSDNWWLLALFWSGVCSSLIVGYLVSIGTTVQNFPTRLHGRIIGLIYATWWSGQSLFTYVYEQTKQKDPPETGEIFLVLGLSIFTTSGLGAIFIQVIPQEENDEESNLVTTGKGSENELSETWVDKLGLRLLKDVNFYLVTLGFICGASVQLMYIINVGSICQTLLLGTLDETILLYSPFLGMVSAFGMGYISDITLHLWPRETYLVVIALLQTILFGVSTVYAQGKAMFIATVVLIYGFNASYFAITSAIVGQRLDMKHFKRNWGILLMLNALVALVLVSVYGFIFDQIALNDGTGICVGMQCLDDIFILCAVISFLSCVSFSVLMFRQSERSV